MVARLGVDNARVCSAGAPSSGAVPTHSPHSDHLHITDPRPSRSLADHRPLFDRPRPRLGACTRSLLQSVLPVKGWTSARPQIVENPPNRMNNFRYGQLANIVEVNTYHPQPAATRTLCLSHCSHSLSNRLPQKLQTGRSRLIHTDTPSIETNIAYPFRFSPSPSPATSRALCISSHSLSKICLNLGAFLQDLA